MVLYVILFLCNVLRNSNMKSSTNNVQEETNKINQKKQFQNGKSHYNSTASTSTTSTSSKPNYSNVNRKHSYTFSPFSSLRRILIPSSIGRTVSSSKHPNRRDFRDAFSETSTSAEAKVSYSYYFLKLFSKITFQDYYLTLFF